MSVTKEEREQIKGEFGKHPQDTGSVEIQIATLSARINDLTEHLKKNKKDHGSKKGLYAIISRRKRLLDYLEKKDPETFKNLVEKIGLRR
ncbi:30S ribosomal protein S15 [Candidatus Aerophobetes bacterium]|nr:30S ribosomal protein S15 [Candidatus Aerophobetes bacterium]